MYFMKEKDPQLPDVSSNASASFHDYIQVHIQFTKRYR